MFSKINALIYSTESISTISTAMDATLNLDNLINALTTNDSTDALLALHQVLYALNLAHFSGSWHANHIHHPYFVSIKFRIESALETHFIQQHADIISSIQSTDFNIQQLIQMITTHASSHLSALDVFLKENASLAQMREFLLQESPLEMLFGDILACMLPGVYGGIKTEMLKNYNDELGNGNTKHIHRNMRARLMKKLGLPEDVYITDANTLILEELQLINLYLSTATSRSKHIRLVGVFMATELSVADHFQHQIAGWKRHGMTDRDLIYYRAHISIDNEHAHDWIENVVKPIVAMNPKNIHQIAFGAIRRLITREAVTHALLHRIQAL